MAKYVFKILFCLVIVLMWVLGLFLMTKDTWYIGSPMILVSVFAFGVACVNGWLDDLMDFVEGYEKRMLG